jgi:hypothetical protein
MREDGRGYSSWEGDDDRIMRWIVGSHFYFDWSGGFFEGGVLALFG